MASHGGDACVSRGVTWVFRGCRSSCRSSPGHLSELTGARWGCQTCLPGAGLCSAVPVSGAGQPLLPEEPRRGGHSPHAVLALPRWCTGKWAPRSTVGAGWPVCCPPSCGAWPPASWGLSLPPLLSAEAELPFVFHPSGPGGVLALIPGWLSGGHRFFLGSSGSQRLWSGCPFRPSRWVWWHVAVSRACAT